MFLLFTSFILSFLGAFLMARFGDSFGLEDRPNERSSHRVVTPKGGGIGILAALLLAGVIVGMEWGVVLAAAGVSGLSLLGDKIEIPPKARLVLQFLFACLALWSIQSTLLSGGLVLFLVPVGLVFVVGTTNFYNFMDGINGIAGISGVVAFGLLAMFSFQSVQTDIAIFAGCLSAACLGFLPFNIPRARVFMGDVGSVLLGFLFAVLVAVLASDLGSLLTMMVFLMPFYVDELTTMAMRLRLRENLFKPHRRHFYQFLANECSIPHWHIALGYGVVQLLLGFLAIGVYQLGLVFIVIFFVGSFLLLAAARYVAQSIMQKKLPQEN